MTDPRKHHRFQLEQLARLDKTMFKMLGEGIPRLSTPFRAVSGAHSLLSRSIGYKIPRNVFALLKLFGLSPGTITLWLDPEVGFFSEARVTPDAPPIYRAVSDDTAMTILKGELTHELEARLMTPDPYVGE